MLEYQYSMLFLDIMDEKEYDKKFKERKHEQEQIDQTRISIPNNPRVRLLQACIEVNDWETPCLILNGIYEG